MKYSSNGNGNLWSCPVGQAMKLLAVLVSKMSLASVYEMFVV